jgi:hypothetical protein
MPVLVEIKSTMRSYAWENRFMANGTSTSHARLPIAEILDSPDRREAYLVEMATWARDRQGGPAPELGPVTITGNTEPTPTRQHVTRALLDETNWLAERLTSASVAGRAAAHLLVFTGLGQETTVLSEVHTKLRQRLLRRGIVIDEFHQTSVSTNAHNRSYPSGLPPWPCYAMRAFIPHHD